MIKTAIIGASGFVGRHLFQAYRRLYPDTIGTSFSRPNELLQPFDIRQPNLASLRLCEQGFESVLICSAKPKIADCQQNKEDAYAVNVSGTMELVRQAVAMGLKPIFLSSDYVFDGQAGDYGDDAPTNPSTEYGRQKQQVEVEIRGLASDYLVLRLGKIYGVEKGDGTLLDEMAAALKAGQKIRAADDMIFSPTLIDDLAQAILAIQSRQSQGVFNICSPQPWSRYQVASLIADALGADRNLIQRIALHELPSMVDRPLNTSMKAIRFAREVGMRFTPLQDSIQRVAANWAADD